MTNGDKIRQMSDEELLTLLHGVDCGSRCPAARLCESREFDNFDCDGVLTVWLKQEVKDE